MAENVPLAQLGDEQCAEVGICSDNRCSEGENENRSVRKNYCYRFLNFARAKSMLFWILFGTKMVCFLAELGVYATQYSYIMDANYSKSMSKVHKSPEAFEEAKILQLSHHYTQMEELVHTDLLILVHVSGILLNAFLVNAEGFYGVVGEEVAVMQMRQWRR
ncbi:hypothetical protein Ddc_17106 [Ditylenchus destructor]|nr:hypothetical protein Ddc_17106 [Ditylenchus destructor]